MNSLCRKNPSTVRQLVNLIQELHDKVNALNDAKEFYDRETASSSGLSYVPSQPSRIPSPIGMISRDSYLPHETRNSMGTSGNDFESLLAQGEPSSALFENSKNLASSSCGLSTLGTGQILGTGRRSETRTAGFYNTNSTLCQEVGDLEPSTSNRRNLFS